MSMLGSHIKPLSYHHVSRLKIERSLKIEETRFILKSVLKMTAKKTVSERLIDEYRKEFYDHYEAPGDLRVDCVKTQ